MYNGIEQALDAVKAAIKSADSISCETSQTTALIDTSDKNATAAPQQTDLASNSAKTTAIIPEPTSLATNNSAPSIPDPQHSIMQKDSSILPTLSSTATTLQILHNQKPSSPHPQSKEISISYESVKSDSPSTPPPQCTPPGVNRNFMNPDIHTLEVREIYLPKKKVSPKSWLSLRLNSDTEEPLTTADVDSVDINLKQCDAKRDEQADDGDMANKYPVPSNTQRQISDGSRIISHASDAIEKVEPASAERKKQDEIFDMDDFDTPANKSLSP